MKKFFSLLVALPLLFMSAHVQAQCTLNQLVGGGGLFHIDGKIGESFVAPCTGNASQVTIRINSRGGPNQVTLYIYDGVAFYGTLLHQQTILAPQGQSALLWTIPIPVSLLAGHQYTIGVSGNAYVYGIEGDPYPSGSEWRQDSYGTVEYPTQDLGFKVDITPCTPVTWYQDSDGDTYGNPLVSQQDCNQPAGYVQDNTDCNDGDANAWQSGTLYIDNDGDGYDAGSTVVCYGNSIPQGYSATTNGADCDDNDNTIHPGATEIFGDNKDNNCDGRVDEYCDAGGAGGIRIDYIQVVNQNNFGNTSNDAYVDNTAYTIDFVRNRSYYMLVYGPPTGTKCLAIYIDLNHDGDFNGPGELMFTTTTGRALIYNINLPHSGYIGLTRMRLILYNGTPSTLSSCGLQGVQVMDFTANIKCEPFTWYMDNDGDSYGNPNVSVVDCNQPAGYVLDNTDCDDDHANVHIPAAAPVITGAYASGDSVINGTSTEADGSRIYLYINRAKKASTRVTAGEWQFNVFPLQAKDTVYVTAAPIDKCATQSNIVVTGDGTPPTLNVPADIVVYSLSCSAVNIPTPNPTYSDNVAVTVLSWKMSGATVAKSIGTGINFVGTRLFNVGVTTITYSAKDSAGNLTQASFTVTLSESTPPTISGTATPVTGVIVKGCKAQLTVPVVTINDNCGVGSLTWVMTGATAGSSPLTGINQVSKMYYNRGTTTITYTVSDKSLNTAQYAVTVIVTDPFAPSITKVPQIAAVATAPGSCTKDLTIATPTITDNCGLRNVSWTMSGATTDASPTTGLNYLAVHTLNAGITTIHYYADDESGNMSDATFTIMVKEAAPVVTCPSDAVMPCMTLSGDYTVLPVVATHNCSTSGAFSYTYSITGATSRRDSGDDASGHFNPGKSKITWTVRDAAGFKATCASAITVPLAACSKGGTERTAPMVEVPAVKADKLQAMVYPNPARDEFALKVQSPKANEEVEINVYSPLGVKVAHMKGQPDQTYHFGASYQRGSYIIEVRQGSERVTLKGLKQ